MDSSADNELQTAKLKLEIAELSQKMRHTRVATAASLLQLIAIVTGVVIGVREFVLKDRDADRQKIATTLTFAGTVNTANLQASRARLGQLRDLVKGAPLPTRRREAFQDSVQKALESGAADLAGFYRAALLGVDAGYYDRGILASSLWHELLATISALTELQCAFGEGIAFRGPFPDAEALGAAYALFDVLYNKSLDSMEPCRIWAPPPDSSEH